LSTCTAAWPGPVVLVIQCLSPVSLHTPDRAAERPFFDPLEKHFPDWKDVSY
jgi:hypothetical protein